MQRKDKHRRGSDDEERHVKELPVDPVVGHVCVHITAYSSCRISSHVKSVVEFSIAFSELFMTRLL